MKYGVLARFPYIDAVPMPPYPVWLRADEVKAVPRASETAQADVS